jgi:aspartyl-tRNA(Asn)/glutamyl-tRNA(Gln) amidotransferase subunit A
MSTKAVVAQSAGVDVIIHPTAISPAPELDATKTNSSKDNANEYMQDILTTPASLAGIPSLSIPAIRATDGWPVGLSVVGQWGTDDLVLRIGELIEDITN